MTHLSAREFVDALEGALEASRKAHLDTCEACRQEVSELRSLMADVTIGGDVPEPSPLFWPEFRRRVHSATGLGAAGSRFGWLLGWRPLTALGMGAAALIMIATLRTGADPGAGEVPALADTIEVDEGSVSIEALLATEAEPWTVVVDAALSVTEFSDIQAPIPGSAELLVEDLTMEERAELLRLLKAEIGGGE
jgi:hypothetical protein